MLRVTGISLPLTYTEEELRRRTAAALGVRPVDIRTLTLYRRSVDARKKERIHFLATVDVTVADEDAVLGRCRSPQVSRAEATPYVIPALSQPPAMRPVVVGCGPAGLFAALTLARAGACPLLLERGGDGDSRQAAVETFRRTGVLDTQNNVQFGEGGAGAFSDGKLNSGIKDPRSRLVLESFAAAGAPQAILWQAKPHIGTDRLRQAVRRLRQEIEERGGEVRFFTTVTDCVIRNGALTALRTVGGGVESEIPCRHVIFAIGHSARDTVTMLRQRGLPMEQKPFAVGVRIEHPRRMIDESQYGKFAGHPALGGGGYKAPAQLVGDFLLGRASTALGEVQPSYRPGVTLTNLADILPGFVTHALQRALPEFGRRIRGFDRPDAVLTGVESRSSSPVRLLRDAAGRSAVQGIFPCGEGAGYAGGILSAAVDGIRCAEWVLKEQKEH